MSFVRKPSLLLVAAIALAGCAYKQPELICTSDTDCLASTTANGFCLDSGDGRRYCANPFPPCPSGYRWSSSASDALRNVCLTPDQVPKDGGVDGAIDAAATDASMDGGG